MHNLLITENLPPRFEPYILTEIELGLAPIHLDDLALFVLETEGANARFEAIVERFDVIIRKSEV